MSKELNDALDAYGNVMKVVADHFGINEEGKYDPLDPAYYDPYEYEDFYLDDYYF